MSEYWKSTPKYWCKHCSTYVKDTPFERKQHENTGKHQGNLKRFLRGIQNDHEKGEREKERAKAEVERLNRVVGGASPATTSSPSKSNTVHKPAARGPTAVDQKRQWAQLAEMGIQVPDNFRGEMAMSGQWQTVSKPTEEIPVSEKSLSIGVRKRKLDGDEDETETSQTAQPRGWGSTTRHYPDQDHGDLDALLTGAIVKKEAKLKTEPKTDAVTASTPELKIELESSNATSVSTERHGAGPDDEPITNQGEIVDGRAMVKGEDEDDTWKSLSKDLPTEVAAPVFKKRKSKVNASEEKC